MIWQRTLSGTKFLPDTTSYDTNNHRAKLIIETANLNMNLKPQFYTFAWPTSHTSWVHCGSVKFIFSSRNKYHSPGGTSVVA